MRTLRRSGASQSGSTLVELLVTITIMGLASIAVFAGLATFYKTTVVQRSTADLDQVVRAYAERLDSAPYAACAVAYSAVTLPDGYTFSTGPTVTYWNGDHAPATFATPCSTDRGLQQVTATVQKIATGQRQTITIAKGTAT